MHNNGLEGINGAFKTNGTCRERSDLGTFSQSVKAWLAVESKNADSLPTTPNVTPPTRRSAQLLATGGSARVDFSMKASLVMKEAGLTIPGMEQAWLMPTYRTVSSLSAPTTVAKRKQLLGLGMKYVKGIGDPHTAASFTQLLNVWKSFYVVWPDEYSEFIKFRCSCPTFWKSCQCPHSLAIGIKHGGVLIPEDRSLEVLGRRKRPHGGRYAKATPALVRQDAEEYDDDDAGAGTAFACSQAQDPCCYICGGRKSTNRNRIVFCDGCDLGYHQKCLQPSLRTIPAGTWFCGRECEALNERLLKLETNPDKSGTIIPGDSVHRG